MNVSLKLALVWVHPDGVVWHQADQQFQQQNHRGRYPHVGCDTQEDHYVMHLGKPSVFISEQDIFQRRFMWQEG